MIDNKKIAVVGATGLVGQKIMEILYERKYKPENIDAYAEEDGETFFGNTPIPVYRLSTKLRDFYDFAFLCVSAEVSKKYAPIFATLGTVVIDNSSAFRLDADVPLVVPEVNPEILAAHNNIIANPNCSTIQSVVALAPLNKHFGIKRIIYSTYQSVSGAGKGGIDDLVNGTNIHTYKRIKNNVVPKIDVMTKSGYTAEELKMIYETKKILSDCITVTATAVRVPVFNAHAVSINVELLKQATIENVCDCLEGGSGITLCDCPTPIECTGKDNVFVGRIRKDEHRNSFNLWVVADNLRKGAALNAIQIAELLIKGGI